MWFIYDLQVTITMTAEPKHITPGDFFLYFHKECSYPHTDTFPFALKTPIVLAEVESGSRGILRPIPLDT